MIVGRHLSRCQIATGVALLVAGPASGEPRFDHSAFDALLAAHVVGGMVDYDAFAKSPEFPKYLDSLAKADITPLSKAERLAFWINTYNAYTIQLIVSHHERDSIHNINKTFGIKGKGPWHEKLVKAAGQVYHLDNVEHDVIRKQFAEPRIHFALVCAAMSCPPLRSQAYTGERLVAQLTDQAKRFLLETPSQNRVDTKTRTVHGSMIYVSYYREDFGATDAAIGLYLARFHPDGPEKQLLLGGRFRLVATEYDWTLNSQENAPKKR
jgi:hypothetical protein